MCTTINLILAQKMTTKEDEDSHCLCARDCYFIGNGSLCSY